MEYKTIEQAIRAADRVVGVIEVDEGASAYEIGFRTPQIVRSSPPAYRFNSLKAAKEHRQMIVAHLAIQLLNGMDNVDKYTHRIRVFFHDKDYTQMLVDHGNYEWEAEQIVRSVLSYFIKSNIQSADPDDRAWAIRLSRFMNPEQTQKNATTNREHSKNLHGD